MHFSTLSCNSFLFADTLNISQKRAKELEIKLAASEQAGEDAEARALTADDIRVKLVAAERALEDKMKQTAECEAAIIKRFNVQCEKFTGNVVFYAD